MPARSSPRRFPLVLVLAATLALPLAGCDTADDGPHPITAGLEVYGFAVTSTERPEVEPGRACGRPTRTSGPIAAVPNPYFGLSVYETDSANRRLRFINLPDSVRIEIVRAYWHTRGPSPSSLWTAGGLARVIPSTGQTVRVIEKGSPSRSLDWDLRDAAGDLVPSGFYRAFFTTGEGSAGGATVFDDLYLIQREDLATWRDPTGCL